MVPDSWVIKDLGDIATISSGGTPSRSQSEYWDGDIPWVTTAEINFGTITKTAQKITSLGMQCSSAKLFPKNTILMAMYGQGKTRGQVAKLSIEATTNQACAAIILKSGYSHEYLFQYLQSEYENIRGMSNGGSQNNLSAGLIKEIPVPVPPFAEQTKIAQILSTWDKAIATTERLLANSKQQKQALIQHLLTGQKRLRGFSQNWRRASVASCLLGSSLRNTNSRLSVEDVMSVNKTDGMIPMREQTIGKSIDRYKIVKPGWFAYNPMRINVGSICRWHKETDCLVSPDYVVFECNEEVLLGAYFDHFRRSESWTSYMESAGNGSVRVRIYLTDLSQLEIPLPSLPEQQKIAQVLSTADAEIANLQAQLDKLKLEKKALMQQLLTGKRRVRLDDEEEDLAPIRRVG
ncbi:restriction endonuclease subunit S [Ectopseudomonas mendocina]|uniref:restriction endonuclease subunit S n=1 Tax=Ectopseudomonas mendocina TaxID=300 RepID=UPI0005A89DA2|nr:restriction endonuclease subunit S [Pseudomonas mendocina]VEE17821.1 Type I restriction-modification system, specificity subunit S [Pseudomonas mendocina]